MMSNLSENAIVVLKKRGYLLPKETPDQMFRRTAKLIASADKNYGADPAGIKKTEEDFYKAMSSLEYLSGSVLLNAGRKRKQFSACYVLPLSDSLEDIYDQLRNAALILRTGGGIGIPLTNLRPRGSLVDSTGGISSGAVSFLRLFNYSAATISESSARRPALMGVLRIDHPDIEEFIKAKEDPASLYHFNISVGSTDEFMKKVKAGKGKIHLFHPNDGLTEKDVNVMDLWNSIAEYAWKVGDPGMVFLDKMNKECPIPKLGKYETTNPCFIGSTRIVTPFGILRMDDLEKIGHKIDVAVDERSKLTADGVPTSLNGLEMMRASAVRRTGIQVPVMTLNTKYGLSVTATPDHRFLTPNGYVELKELRAGDKLLIQSAEGIFSSEKLLPNHWQMEELSSVLTITDNNQKQLAANRTTASGLIPQKWSKEVGEVLGWIVGDGWLTATGKRVGIVFGHNNPESARNIGGRLNEWFGGCESKRDRVIQFTYSASAYQFFSTLGVQPVRAGLKRVPESVWVAPRDGVIGFLRGLFGADGTFQWDKKRQYSSVRLASNYKLLLQDVQLLLLNLSVLGKIFLRRNAQWRMMPDSHGLPKKYWTQPQYELIVGAQHRNRFLLVVGFADQTKQRLGEEFLGQMSDGAYEKPFMDIVESIVPAGQADVYDLSQPTTKSYIANGFVVHNCGEQPLLPYESCNLGNINLGRFVKDEPRTKSHELSEESSRVAHRTSRIDWPRLEEVIRLGVHFQDNVIDLCEYPIQQLQKMAKTTRKIGLGVMGWADMLIKLGIRYDSEEALKLAEKTAKFIQETARDESVELGKKRGSFPAFGDSVWKKKGFKTMRNSTVNTVAPTGTISIIAGCSSGIEPLFALAYRRENILDLGKTSLIEVNQEFEKTVKDSLFDKEKTVLNRVIKSGSCQNIKEISQEVKNIFRVSMEIPFQWHIKMQAAWQKYTDAAVSKTINLPNSATVDDIKNAYLLAFETGCKGITVYRDGCRGEQVLNVGKKNRSAINALTHKRINNSIPDEACPECGGEIEFTDGCSLCRSCGFSKCSV
jgi:ribonucleoside-diphosphate reductase alpha chain